LIVKQCKELNTLSGVEAAAAGLLKYEMCRAFLSLLELVWALGTAATA
jgi:hypothetical protein